MKIQPGDRIAYTAAFVKQTGHDKNIADMRGTVKEDRGNMGKNQYLRVLWDGETEYKGCLSCNICKIKSPSFADADLPDAVKRLENKGY